MTRSNQLIYESIAIDMQHRGYANVTADMIAALHQGRTQPPLKEKPDMAETGWEHLAGNILLERQEQGSLNPYRG